jgi:hypothetical protein
MKERRFIIPAVLLAAMVYGVVSARPALQTGTHRSVVEQCGLAEDVVVRFYYNPMINQPNLSPGPLIVLPVSSQDPQVGTKSGWLLRITLADLHSMLRTLVQSNLECKESDSPKQLVVEPFGLPQPHHDSMQVAVSCPTGSATAEVEARQVCRLLSNVSKSLSSPTAREAVSFYGRTVSCSSAVRGGSHGGNSRSVRRMAVPR